MSAEGQPVMARERNVECNKPSKDVGQRRVPARAGNKRNDNEPMHHCSQGAHGDEFDETAQKHGSVHRRS